MYLLQFCIIFVQLDWTYTSNLNFVCVILCTILKNLEHFSVCIVHLVYCHNHTSSGVGVRLYPGVGVAVWGFLRAGVKVGVPNF